MRQLILLGPPTKNINQARIDYEIDRVALGIDSDGWTGTVIRDQWVAVAVAVDGGREIRSALPLPPSDSFARAWVLDGLSAQTAQAIGRLRAVQRPEEELEVLSYGAVPLVGHGIQVHEFQTGPGAVQKKAETAQAVAEAVITSIDAGQNPTRRLIAATLAAAGRRPSNGTIDKILASIRRSALANQQSFEQAAKEVVAVVKRLTGAGMPAGTMIRMARLSRGAAKATWVARARLANAMASDGLAASPASRRAGP